MSTLEKLRRIPGLYQEAIERHGHKYVFGYLVKAFPFKFITPALGILSFCFLSAGIVGLLPVQVCLWVGLVSALIMTLLNLPEE